MQSNYIIRMTHEGLPCWHIVRVAKVKEPLLQKLAMGADVDISTLGEILESGWGKNISDEIKTRYGALDV